MYHLILSIDLRSKSQEFFKKKNIKKMFIKQNVKFISKIEPIYLDNWNVLFFMSSTDITCITWVFSMKVAYDFNIHPKSWEQSLDLYGGWGWDQIWSKREDDDVW